MKLREKKGTLINAKKQITDGSIDELLLDDDLKSKLQRIDYLEKRLKLLEEKLGDIANLDPVTVYETAKH